MNNGQDRNAVPNLVDDKVKSTQHRWSRAHHQESKKNEIQQQKLEPISRELYVGSESENRPTTPLVADVGDPVYLAPTESSTDDNSTYINTPTQKMSVLAPQGKTFSSRFSSRFFSRFMAAFEPGLSLKQRLRMLPYLGYSLAFFSALVRLPMVRHQGLLANQELGRLRELTEQLSLRHGHLLAQHSSSLEHHQADLQSKTQALELAAKRDAILDERLLKTVSRLERYDHLDIGKRLMQLDQLQLARHNRSILTLLQTSQKKEAALVARIEALEMALRNNGSLPSVAPAPLLARIVPEEFMVDDQFYVDFEAAFRGSRDEIKQRLHVYLPQLATIPRNAQNEAHLLVDVGCGRGEWLELLAENRIPSMGVDLNTRMVEGCVERGLYAICDDAIAVLRAQEAGSLGAVTGFHIIEHLPFAMLISLFDAAYHALCPGGLIIFETPNPENLKVGACNFYFDPTHLSPIVPQVAEFMARQRGFTHTEIVRLHPFSDECLLVEESAAAALMNKELFGPRDYALIGRK
ncbi:MAG: class I SAM-dependent methyltransferase [Undibacterium sp.]|nr:class I SAM-dependent methyltransferase [Undibacterium sp.]